VDCHSAGYSCQPFSVAGRRQGTDDPRHLWLHVARFIAECAPEWVFLENVANHLNLGYREVRGEMEGLDFRVEEGLFTAADLERTVAPVAPRKPREGRAAPAPATVHPGPCRPRSAGSVGVPEILTAKGNHFIRPSGKKAHLGLDQAARPAEGIWNGFFTTKLE